MVSSCASDSTDPVAEKPKTLRRTVRRLEGHYQRFKDNQKYSDLTLTCGDKSWHVHKVVCSQSKYLELACDDLKPDGPQEIHLPIEDDVEHLNHMIAYFYDQDYTDCERDAPCAETNSLLLNAHIYALAHKYGVPKLKALAIAKTVDSLGEIRERVLHLDFCYLAEIAFTSTDASDFGLRELYVKEFVMRRHEILKLKESEREKVVAALEKIPGFFQAVALFGVDCPRRENEASTMPVFRKVVCDVCDTTYSISIPCFHCKSEDTVLRYDTKLFAKPKKGAAKGKGAVW